MWRLRGRVLVGQLMTRVSASPCRYSPAEGSMKRPSLQSTSDGGGLFSPSPKRWPQSDPPSPFPLSRQQRKDLNYSLHHPCNLSYHYCPRRAKPTTDTSGWKDWDDLDKHKWCQLNINPVDPMYMCNVHTESQMCTLGHVSGLPWPPPRCRSLGKHCSRRLHRRRPQRPRQVKQQKLKTNNEQPAPDAAALRIVFPLYLKTCEWRLGAWWMLHVFFFCYCCTVAL